jgi:hypothetical protein
VVLQGCCDPSLDVMVGWRFRLGTKKYNVTTKWCAEPASNYGLGAFLDSLWLNGVKGFSAWNCSRVVLNDSHAVIGHSPLSCVSGVSTQSVPPIKSAYNIFKLSFVIQPPSRPSKSSPQTKVRNYPRGRALVVLKQVTDRSAPASLLQLQSQVLDTHWPRSGDENVP